MNWHLPHFSLFRLSGYTLRTSSVVQALFWPCLIVTPAFGVMATFASDAFVQRAFVVLAALPEVALIVAYFIWAFRDPNRLQSENYQFASQALPRLGDSDNSFRLASQFISAPMMNPQQNEQGRDRDEEYRDG